MATNYVVYNVPCLDGDGDRKIIKKTTDPAPTKCDVNTNHNVDADNITIYRTFKEHSTDVNITGGIMRIKEEDVETQRIFQAFTVDVTSPPNTNHKQYLHYPKPVTALSIEFTTGEAHRGDQMNVGFSFLVGVLMATAQPIPDIYSSSQGYPAGAVVTYYNPKLKVNRVYTSTQVVPIGITPMSSAYWKHGYKLVVSPTVFLAVKNGFHVTLASMAGQTDMGEVISYDKATSSVWVDKMPDVAHPAFATTFTLTAFLLNQYDLWEPWEHELGTSRIGGSYLPPNTVVFLNYHNKSLVDVKRLKLRLEILY